MEPVWKQNVRNINDQIETLKNDTEWSGVEAGAHFFLVETAGYSSLSLAVTKPFLNSASFSANLFEPAALTLTEKVYVKKIQYAVSMNIMDYLLFTQSLIPPPTAKKCS